MNGTHLVEAVAAWLVAAVWTVRVAPALFYMRQVPDLNRLAADCVPVGMPSITVVVPAKDEGAAIEATLRSLAAQEYGPLDVVAVDDRSVDTTGATMDAIAAEFPGRVRAVHIRALPAGWAGKIYAMTCGAEGATGDYLLFTDGDITFAPDALRRALTVAVETHADHFVCLPTLDVRRWDEGVLLGVFQALSGLAVRLWKVPDPRAKRDALGVGAFSLVRRTAFEQLGGYARRPLEIVEDLRLGQDMKAAGFRSVVAFGAGLVRLHWAAGATGIVRAVTKNFFAALRYRLLLVFVAAVGIVAMFWIPLVGFFVPGMRGPAVISVVAMAALFRQNGPRTGGVSAWYGLLSPVGAVGVAAALMWSAFETLRRGGVRWRGTFYPLDELRRAR